MKSLLRFITCGSVDDGKSTLIGRLLYDAKAVADDQLSALAADSRRFGTQGAALDFALLVDGLSAEREQKITIDVAYRFFSTARRSFIVADTPGHEQYTRNMVTGASTADLAVLLVDARHGVLTQTRRHAFIARLLGIGHVVLAVNKMDLVDWDASVFASVVADFGAPAVAIPVSGLLGDNITQLSPRTPWYDGPTLLEHLERVDVIADDGPFRMPVQWVNRPNLDFRGFAGTVAGGSVSAGMPVRIVPGGTTTVVESVLLGGEVGEATAGQSVTLTLRDEVDCSRGSVIAIADDPPVVADQLEATVIWMANEPLLPGRAYWLKLATQTVSATVRAPKYRFNVDTGEHLATKTLELNAIGVTTLATDRPIVMEPYSRNKTLGGFILIDKLDGATVGAGLVHFALRRSQNIHWQALDVTREARAELKGQRAAVVWLTGLSGAGKSTIANMVEKKLAALGRHTFLLDGDNVRHALNRDLGFTAADRIENVRRVGEVARLMTDAGLIVIAAFISPFRAERAMVRSLMAPGEFIEVHVDTPLATAEARDVKGLYKKARAGLLENFTGIDSPYEIPDAPELRIDTRALSPEAAAERIVALLSNKS